MDTPESTNPPSPQNQERQSASKRPEHTYGMLCHLLSLTALVGVPFGHLLGPLVMWLVKKEEHSFVDRCGKESLNFQITVTLAAIALGVLAFISTILAMIPLVGIAIGLIILPLIVIAFIALIAADITFTVIASIKASEGTHYVYPYSLRLIK